MSLDPPVGGRDTAPPVGGRDTAPPVGGRDTILSPAPQPQSEGLPELRELGRLGTLLRWYASCRDGRLEEPKHTRTLSGGQAAAEADEQGLARGQALVDQHVDAGAELLLLADPQAAQAEAVAVIALFAEQEPVAAVGWGDAGDEASWADEVTRVRDERYRLSTATSDLQRWVELVPAEIAVTTGICLQAALRRTPLLLDGEVSAAGALIADRLRVGVAAWWHAAHRTGRPAHDQALSRIGLTPTLALDLPGGGLGPVLALDALRTTIRTLG